MSLTFALRAIAEGAGYELELDDLNAALGLSLMTSAVPDEDDLAHWPMYARDAFLVEAGRLFGMSIRDIHPPEAARGLSGVGEFDQHFDASYRPLILRALEHGQAVLAWQGWPGERAMMWGIIRNSSSEGSGFQGVCHCPKPVGPTSKLALPVQSRRVRPGRTVGSLHTKTRSVRDAPYKSVSHTLPSPHDALGHLTLERPPVQVYVVETITKAHPNPDELLDVALNHARRVLTNGLKDRFDVVTGPPAYDAWIARWRNPQGRRSKVEGPRSTVERVTVKGPKVEGPRSQIPDLPTFDLGPSGLLMPHRQLADSVSAAHRSAIRFLNRQHQRTEGKMRRLVKALMQECHKVATSLEESIDVASDAALTKTSEGRTRIVEAITRAKDATTEMLCALQGHAPTANSEKRWQA